MRCLVKWAQCLVMGELKQIRVSSFKSLIVASLPLEYKKAKSCKALVGAPIRFSTTQTGLKMRKIRVGSRDLEL